jgi:hypothetical protein
MMPAKHGVDGLYGFRTIRFIDTTYVYTKVSQAVAAGLISAELDLAIANLTLSSTVYHVSKSDLLLSTPYVYKSIACRENVAAEDLGQTELAIVVTF